VLEGMIAAGQRVNSHHPLIPPRVCANGRARVAGHRAVAVRASTAETVVDDVANGVANAAQSSAVVVKQGLAAVDKVASVASDAYSKVSPAIEKAGKAVGPIVSDAVEVGKPIASSLASGVAKASSSAASGVASRAVDALKEAGVSPSVIKSADGAVSGAYSAAKPLVSSLLSFVSTAEPATLVSYSAAAAAFVVAFPAVASAVARAVRGYAGAASPAIVLDRLSTGPQVVLVDIRSVRDKEANGLPDMRDKSKYVQLEAAVVEDGRVRRELKNIGSLEVTMTAMQVAALKKVSKKTELYIMDKNGSVSKAVARQIAAKGFGNVNVVKGGFSAWARERLPVRMAETVGRVEVVAPSVVLFGSTKRSIADGTATTTKRGLPAPPKPKALPQGRS
jgi:rhodanese-related sulfurtransferase